MPTTKVDEKRCGTLHPIWLRTPTGTHPRPSTSAAPVTITACVNINGRNGGCFSSFNVGVKFCSGNYFVYYLHPMPLCSIAYCAGKVFVFPNTISFQSPDESQLALGIQ